MKNLVIISQVFYPNSQSTSLLLTDLAIHIQDSNTKITVICGFSNEACNDLVEENENFKLINIKRCGINIDSKAGMWQRLISYISFLFHTTWELIISHRKSFLVGVSNPPFLSIFLMIVSVLNNCKYSFIIHDVYPEGLVAVSKLNENSLATKMWRRLNKISYDRATKIVVLGRDMKELIVKNYEISPDKIEYIPNWSLVKSNAPTPFEENKIAIDLGIQNNFVIQYSGNMGLWHDIDTFIRAAARLSNKPNIKFLFIGNGIRRTQAQQLAQKLELQNVMWMDFVPKERLSTSLSCAHVALISLNLGLEGIAVPCKLYGILGAGRAILAQVPSRSEIAYTVSEEECGFVVTPGDVDELVKKIIELEADRSLINTMGNRAFQAYQSKYTVETIAKQFKKILPT